MRAIGCISGESGVPSKVGCDIDAEDQGPGERVLRSPRAIARLLPACLVFVGLLILGAAAADAQSQTDDAQDSAPDMSAFLGLLEGLKLAQGDETAAWEELSREAQRLCDEHGRCDALEIALYYHGLSQEERANGLKAWAEYRELHGRVYAAGNSTSADEASWPELRREVQAGLTALAARVRGEADYQPAARAFSLLALLEVDESRQEGEHIAEYFREELRSKAEDHALTAIELFGACGHLRPQIEPLDVLASIESARHDPAAARAFYERIQAIATQVGEEDAHVSALLKLVGLARDAGDVARVDRYLSALARLRTPAECWPLAREHATRLLHTDRPQATIRFLENFAPSKPDRQGEWHALMGAALLRAGSLVDAQREIETLGGKDGGELGILARASLDLALDRATRVIETLGGGEEGTLNGWSHSAKTQACALVGEAWLSKGKYDNAAKWLVAALEHANDWQSEQAVDPQGSGSVIGEWIGLHVVVLLAQSYSQTNQALEAARIIEEFQSRSLRFNALHSAEAPVSTPLTDHEGGEVTTDDLAAWANHYEGGLITWGVGADSSVVAHIARDGRPAWATAIPYGRRDLETAVRRLREATIAADVIRARSIATELTQALIPGPLRQRLLDLGVEDRVLFLLHGPLESLPLSILELDGRTLDQCFTSVSLPGIPSHRPGQRIDPSQLQDWTLMGGPLATGDDPRPLLPGATRELADLALIHGNGRLHTGSTFVRQALIEALDASNPLHVATHMVVGGGCSDGRLAPVGLLLSGGDVLCATDILAQRPRLPLVVLTACETAGGRKIDAEGLHGITRAFLEPGTRNLIVTLWPVEDGAARRFATAFHEEFAKGCLPSIAARKARMTMRKQRGTSSADWAAFQCIGRD